MDFELTYKRFSERSILIEWPMKIEPKVLDDVLAFKRTIEYYCVKDLIQVNNAYNSILITYKHTIENSYDEFYRLKALYVDRFQTEKKKRYLWKLPVCYDEKFALDLELMAREKKRSKQEIIEQHWRSIYTVYFIGFLPGFLYLGGLDSSLSFPRRESPRQHVGKGAVAIGGHQTGIYPNDSPGGWHIIGKSPLEFFNPKHDKPCFAQAGDHIQFMPIDTKAFDVIAKQVQNGNYQIESEVLDG